MKQLNSKYIYIYECCVDLGVMLCCCCRLPQIAGNMFAGWWNKMRPYYTKAYQEMWVGLGIMTFLYYKVSYGGEFKTCYKCK